MPRGQRQRALCRCPLLLLPGKEIRRRLLAACIAIISASQARAQALAAPDSAGVERHIRNVTSRLMVETASRGIYTSGEVNNYQLKWAREFGVRDAATRLPLTPATRFQARSVSKPTFAVAVMRLVERGEISLDQDVNSYLTVSGLNRRASFKRGAKGSWMLVLQQDDVTLTGRKP